MNFDDKENRIKLVMIILVTTMITFLVTAFFYTYYFTNTDQGIRKVFASHTKKINNKKFDDIIKLVKYSLNKYYLGELKEEDMLDGAIKGYVKGVGDPYTEYLTESEYESLNSSISGNYVGIGVYVSKDKNDQVIVLLPIEGSPAEEAEIKSGDIILKANGEELTGLDLDLAVNKIKGEEGTTVELEILRDGETIKKTVERRKVELKDMDSKMLDNNIGYIQLVTFDKDCAEEFMKHYKRLKEQGMKSLIIDIRDNGGGLVTEVIELADYFLPEDKTIMNIHDKDGKTEVSKSKKKPQIENTNIVLLVNENSASASEILAAALQDNKIATIVGEKTFGKGVMQELISFGKGALKITVEEFRTPDGKVINKEGITPDVEVEDDKKTEDIDEQLDKAIEVMQGM